MIASIGRRPSEAPTRIRPRILVISPVRLLRDGLAGMVQQRFGAHGVCTAAGVESALVVLGEHRPTLILLDVATEDGLAVARSLIARDPGLRILGFAARAHDQDLLAYARAGISGFVSREASTADLFDAIERSARGELLCSPRIAATLFRVLAELAAGPRIEAASKQLTGRECEIVRCIDEGLSNKQIARQLSIEVSTVKNHVHNILEKLHVDRRSEAAARVRNGTPVQRSPTGRSIHP